MSRLGHKFSAGVPGGNSIYVATTGSDTTGDGSSGTPFATIAHAHSVATSATTIYVFSGVYNATSVTITKSNITLQGYGSTKPILDAGGIGTGAGKVIGLTNVTNVTIDGFEIRNAVGTSNIYGILAESAVANCTISNNFIYGIHATGASSTSVGIGLGTNASPGVAHDNLIQHNTIYDIGPGGESWGIWMLYSKNNTVDGNTIFCVRKEGVRDWVGYRNRFINNHCFLNWNGLELETSDGSYTANNVCHHNIFGYNLKHVNDLATAEGGGAQGTWGVQEWCKYWHNTSYKNVHADIGIAMAPAPIADFIDIRDNLFDGGGAGGGYGTANLNDFRGTRGTNVIVDYNAYRLSQNSIIYFSGFPTETNLRTSLAALQADTALNWEANGQEFAPTYANPNGGDFRVTNRASLTGGINLGDAWGAQIGAEPTVMPSHAYQEFDVTVISTPPKNPANNSSQFSNKNDDSYWLSAAGVTSGAFVCDFGATITWNVAYHAIYSQGDPNCPKSIHLDVSDDNVTWTTVLDQVNPDNEQSSYKYLLFPGSATGRYVRFRYDSVFSGGTQTNVADFGFGLITAL